MKIKPGLLTIAAAGLIAGLCGCGNSAGTSGSDAASATSATPSQTSSPMSSMSTTTAAGAATSASPPAAKGVLITIKDFKYTLPATVAPGSKIMVKNEDSVNHTVTSVPKGTFDVKAEAGGGTGTFTAPTKPGSYPFVCTFHANMTGTLIVK